MAAPKKELRFEIGARVECNCGMWRQGTVVMHWYRDPDWPEGKVVPYQIKIDNGPTIFAPQDDDKCIRRITGILSVGKIPVTVLTGFLGAGKTTLLNVILTKQHGKKYAVIENEFGEVPIDKDLLAVEKKDTVESITVLDNGCLCCTVRDDLVGAVKQICEAVEKRYAEGHPIIDGILIETTGMADPGPIVKTFSADDNLLKYCKIDGILTVVDCKHFIEQLSRERQEDAVNESAQQIAFADKILLNKIDVCEADHIAEVKGAIRGVNNLVPIRECSIAKDPDNLPIGELLAIEAFDGAKLLAGLQGQDDSTLVVLNPEEADAAEAAAAGYAGHGGGHEGGHDGGHGGHGDCADDCEDASHGHSSGHGAGHGAGHGHGHGKVQNRHDTDIKSMVLEKRDVGLDMHEFQRWLGTILQERSVDLYRYKGILAVQQKTKTLLYILQGVHDMPELTFSSEWPEGKPIKTQIVLIGRKLDTEGYRKGFEECFI